MRDIWQCGDCGQKWTGNNFRVKPCPICNSKNVSSIMPDDIRQIEQQGETLRALDSTNHSLNIGISLVTIAIVAIIVVAGFPALMFLASLMAGPIGVTVAVLSILCLILGWLNKMARKRGW